MIDTDGDGFGNTAIDLANNDGRPDKFVAPNGFDEFLSINSLLII